MDRSRFTRRRWLIGTLLLLGGCAPLLLEWPTYEDATASALERTRPGETLDLHAAFRSLPGVHVGAVRVQALRDNGDAWTARWRLLDTAGERIDVAYFILSQDVFGMAFLGHLLAKARAGVEVRVLVDAVGRSVSQSVSRLPNIDDCLPALADVPKLSVRIFRPLPRRVTQALLTLTPGAAAASNHDKIIVVDGRIGLIGGRNIAEEYFAHPADLRGAFHDLDIVLEAPAAAAALTDAFAILEASPQAAALGPMADGPAQRCLLAFEEAYRAMDAWLRADGPAAPAAARATGRWQQELLAFDRLRGALQQRPAGSRLEAEVVIVDSLPRLIPTRDPVSHALFQLLDAARREALIASPYLVLTDRAAQEFRAAGADCDAITVLTNSPVSSDNPLSQALFRRQWPELMAYVPNLRIFVSGTERNLHSKFAVFDGAVALVGAFNLDPFSLAINGEIAAAIWSPELAQALVAETAQLLDKGPPHVYQYRIARGAPGEVRVAFGAADHSDPQDWPEPSLLWRMLPMATYFPGTPTLFSKPANIPAAQAGLPTAQP